MRGAIFLGADKNKKFEIREAELPTLGVKDVLIKNYACGICGTDVHIYHGEKGSAEVAPGVILSEPVEMRRRIGLKVGADAAIDPLNESLKERLIDITGYEGADE